jgi:hypothetical protein
MVNKPFLYDYEANVMKELHAELLHKAGTCKNVKTMTKRWEQFHILGLMLSAFQVIREEEVKNDTP